jgi:osmotically-inducible protein OsmY
MKNSTDKYKKSEQDLKDAQALEILKDNSRSNPTGIDDDLAIDIEDAIGRDASLSLVADNILVTVEGEIVTLEGAVNSEGEKMTVGDIATSFAGEDFVNNYLNVAKSGN